MVFCVVGFGVVECDLVEYDWCVIVCVGDCCCCFIVVLVCFVDGVGCFDGVMLISSVSCVSGFGCFVGICSVGVVFRD